MVVDATTQQTSAEPVSPTRWAGCVLVGAAMAWGLAVIADEFLVSGFGGYSRLPSMFALLWIGQCLLRLDALPRGCDSQRAHLLAIGACLLTLGLDLAIWSVDKSGTAFIPIAALAVTALLMGRAQVVDARRLR